MLIVGAASGAAHFGAIHSGTTHQASLLAQPGTVAFLVVFGMAVLLYFVFRSMSKHLRKVNQAAREEAEALARDAQLPDGSSRP